jgi:hypothetical protein
VEFGSRMKETELVLSMGSVADAYDNSMAERVLTLLLTIADISLLASSCLAPLLYRLGCCQVAITQIKPPGARSVGLEPATSDS